MGLSQNISTYGDVRQVLDIAIKEGGAIATLPTPGKAVHFRHRARNFAKLYREFLFARGELAEDAPTRYDNLDYVIEGAQVRIMPKAVAIQVSSIDGEALVTIGVPKAQDKAPPKSALDLHRTTVPDERPLSESEQELLEQVKGLGLRITK